MKQPCPCRIYGLESIHEPVDAAAKGGLLETLKFCDEIRTILEDADLAFTLPGNPTLGRLFLELTRCGSLFAEVNHHVLREAALIFMAKASVCLRVMNKPLHPQVATWIG